MLCRLSPTSKGIRPEPSLCRREILFGEKRVHLGCGLHIPYKFMCIVSFKRDYHRTPGLSINITAVGAKNDFTFIHTSISHAGTSCEPKEAKMLASLSCFCFSSCNSNNNDSIYNNVSTFSHLTICCCSSFSFLALTSPSMRSFSILSSS